MTEELQVRFHISGGEAERIYEAPMGVSRIGRSPTLEICLDHPDIAPTLAQVERQEEGCELTLLVDSGSVYVNGSPIDVATPFPLWSGDRIEIGPFLLRYEEEAAAAAPSPAADGAAAAGGEVPDGEEEPGGRPPSSILPPSMLAAPPPPPDYSSQLPPGLERHSIRYINYLPGIYQTDFVSRFLALFESILMPVEWNIAGFDLYLSPETAPSDFLPWLAHWFGITFDPTWSDSQRRLFLSEAHHIFSRRGTRRALQRVLEIYTGRTVEIIDQGEEVEPFTFTVVLPVRERDVNRKLIERIIEADKPAHTSYRLEFSKKLDMDVVFSKLD